VGASYGSVASQFSYEPPLPTSASRVLTLYGALAVTFMMVMYAFESRSPYFIAAFALGCALSSSYGFLAGTWPFGAVEAVWTMVALRRFFAARVLEGPGPSSGPTWAGKGGGVPE